MRTIDHPIRVQALALTMITGAVDSIAFTASTGYFVSFMSGNSTRFAAGAVDGARGWQTAGGLLIAFFAGVVIASFVRARHARLAQPLGLAALACLLAAAGLSARLALEDAPLWLMAFAMGGANIILVNRDKQIIGVTYMTGTLVKIGQGLGGMLAGAHDAAPLHMPLLLWLALVSGAVFGAIAYRWLGMDGLFVIAGVVLVLIPLGRPAKLAPYEE